MKIVALGDSTTAGTPGFLSPLESPPGGSGDVTSQYSYWLMEQHPDWEVLNRGVNRERTDQIAARFDRDVLTPQPEVVVIIGGVNDIYDGRGADHAIANLRSMYERAHRAGIAVVAGTILPFNTATPDHNLMSRVVNDWIRSVRPDTLGVFVVADTRAAVARPGDPDLLASTADGLHPDPRGYRAMALALAPAIERAIALNRREHRERGD